MPNIPGPEETFDDANRPDGPIYVNAAQWQNKGLDYGPTGIVTSGHEIKSTGDDQSVFTASNFEDSFKPVYFNNTTGGAYGFYWYVQDDGRFYWFVANGLSWQIKKRTIGFSNAGDEILDSTTVESSLSGGVGVRVYQRTFEVYRYEDGAWAQEPVLSAADDDDAFVAGPLSVNIPNINWSLAGITTADPSLSEPAGPTVLYVDADHINASDGYSRSQVDADHPLLTPDRAGMLAYATPTTGSNWADTILIKHAANANPDDERGETTCYPPMDHRLNTRGARPAGYPFGDNTGNAKITVKGATTINVNRWDVSTLEHGTYAAMRAYSSRRLKNWHFEDVQFGYDVGGGNDYLTLNPVERSADLTYKRCLFTGGSNQYSLWEGTARHENCASFAPLSPGANDPFDGRAFGTSPDPNDSDGGQNSGRIEWVDSIFENVRGNDAIQASVGAYTPAPNWGSVFVDRCTFTNVIGGAPQFHTDSIQILGGPLFEIQRSAFIGCETALIASDFHNGNVRLDACLIVGTGGQITIQGTDNFRMRNCTVLTFGADVSHALFLVDRTTGIRTLGDVRNNILQSVSYRDRGPATWWADGTVFDNNAVIRDPGGTNPWGANLPGIPEFGTSDRVDDLGLPTSYVMGDLPDPLPLAFELARTGTFTSPGVGQGVPIDDPDFPDTDILGRPWDPTAPDLGCFQGDPGTDVQPAARGPYIFDPLPVTGTNGVTAFSANLYPVPGSALNESTVNDSTFLVLAPNSATVLGTVTTGALDEDGFQLVRREFATPLRDMATFRGRLTTGIEDQDGNALAANFEWSATTGGSNPFEPPDGGYPGGWAIGEIG